ILLKILGDIKVYLIHHILCSNAQVMLAAGTGTSISTMEWTMSLLMNHPSVLNKAGVEIEKYAGHDRRVQESDMSNLPYLGCIIKESMRMLPPGPLLPHESAEDCMVGGYHIPKRTMLLVNVWAIHNDPNIWGDPDSFRPERFEGLEGYRDGFKLMPFGFGRRGCPGEDMGIGLVRLALGSLIQCFEWERTRESEGPKDFNMSKATSLVQHVALYVVDTRSEVERRKSPVARCSDNVGLLFAWTVNLRLTPSRIAATIKAYSKAQIVFSWLHFRLLAFKHHSCHAKNTSSSSSPMVKRVAKDEKKVKRERDEREMREKWVKKSEERERDVRKVTEEKKMEAFYYYMPLILLAIFIFTDYFLHKLQNLPPRPWLPPLPIIGHLYLLKKPLHRSLAKLSAKHGPVQLLQFGSRRVLVVSSPSAAEECFTKNDMSFANRPRVLAGKYLGNNYTSLVFAPYGNHYRNLRRISYHEVFSSHRLKEFEPIRADEVCRMMRKLFRSSLKHDTVVRPMLVDLTLNVVMRMISGKRYCYSKDDVLTNEEKEKANRFKEIVNEIMKFMGATNVGDYLPMLRWLGVSKLEQRLISLKAKRDLFMQELVEEIKESMEDCCDGKQRKNMIQMLLFHQKSEPDFYTDEMIRSIMLVMLAGGTGTSTSTMEWTMSLLLNHPSVLNKAQVEIEKYVGHDRRVEESDMSNLPYLGCIIKESMRMLPPGPLLPHESAEDCMVGGYHIPKRTMLLVNVWAIHNDPNIWGDPNSFRPERFEGLEGYRDGFKLMPFGFGRRGCPGEDMGIRLVKLALGSLIQCFEWERTSESEVDLSEGAEGLNMSKATCLAATCRPRPTMFNLLSYL
ncbi:LOW QUALITY PROTEIN: hypothetical protein M8C21_006508, partial [Ambrosia artemisiifolia]